MPAALITGASSGIGEQFAYFLARDGYTLALSARREDRLRAVAAEARRRGAPAVSVFPADLGQRPAAAELYGQVAAAGLKIELLVNNAGFGTRGRFDHLPLERELEEIDLNVSALVALTHLFLPGMIASRKGTVINVASTASFQPVPHMATYAATKAFVLSFSQGLHYELTGSGVNVMALCPGRHAHRIPGGGEQRNGVGAGLRLHGRGNGGRAGAARDAAQACDLRQRDHELDCGRGRACRAARAGGPNRGHDVPPFGVKRRLP